jgi:hypothetical protein
MSSDDFYAPPTASVSDEADAISVEGNAFDVVSGEIQTRSPLLLPADLCVKCGSHDPAGKTYEKKVYYVSKWLVLAIFLNLLIMLILYMILRKKLEVLYHLCPECLQLRKKRILLSVAGLGGALLGFGFGISLPSMPLLLISGIAAFASLIALIIFANPPLRARAYSSGLFTVKGASPEFLDQIRKRHETRREPSSVW